MSVLSDHWIKKMSLEKKMISPFVKNQQRKNKISYGLSSYGYDARVSNEFKIFTNIDSALVDPKKFSNNSFVTRKTDVCIIPPNSFALARTVEYFKIPRDVLVICLGKSTTTLPAKIYANEGACQFIFLKGDQEPETSYADKKGKYMKQKGVTLPKI